MYSVTALSSDRLISISSSSPSQWPSFVFVFDFKSSFCPSSHCCSYLTQIHTQNQSINKYLMRRCRRSSSANCRPVLLLLLLLLSYISSSASAPLSVMQSDVTTDTYRGHDMNTQWGSVMRFINCFLTAEFILHTHTARLYSNNQLLVL